MKTIILIASLAACVACEPEYKNTVNPNDAAKAYLEALKIPNSGVFCTLTDTDNDGYVTCTYSQPSGDNANPKLSFISCAPVGGRTGRCKPK